MISAPLFLRRLPAGLLAGILTALLPLTAFAGSSFSLKDNPGAWLDVLTNGRPVIRYMYGHDVSTKDRRTETYKPYCHVFSADGSIPITKGPGGTYPHHRGIFLGWNKITVDGKKFDRWHMVGGDQVHEKFLTQSGGEEATFTSLIQWQGAGPDAAPILTEERTFTVRPVPAPAYACIDLVSKVKAIAGQTELDGDPEHAGLQFRPAQEVNPAETTYVFPGAAAKPHKDLDYPWFGESFTLAGQRYSVVYLNHPDNPRETRISAYRDYGRFGAFFRKTLAKDEVLTLKVRLLISEGPLPPVESLQSAWNTYTGRQEPVPALTSLKAERSAPPKPKAPAATTVPTAPAK